MVIKYGFMISMLLMNFSSYAMLILCAKSRILQATARRYSTAYPGFGDFDCSPVPYPNSADRRYRFNRARFVERLQKELIGDSLYEKTIRAQKIRERSKKFLDECPVTKPDFKGYFSKLIEKYENKEFNAPLESLELSDDIVKKLDFQSYIMFEMARALEGDRAQKIMKPVEDYIKVITDE